ncbi:hypothetical protein PR048_025279 [Dryococelus australis]|uniref:Uncharacterized protein n=1 Tax=Dryococelus australis TaxID=614101 RepID=A0ABQ9GQX8_9NEOP|nr:hypothetical protein PR048_025279 [Dryococelus australis]
MWVRSSTVDRYISSGAAVAKWLERFQAYLTFRNPAETLEKKKAINQGQNSVNSAVCNTREEVILIPRCRHISIPPTSFYFRPTSRVGRMWSGTQMFRVVTSRWRKLLWAVHGRRLFRHYDNVSTLTCSTRRQERSSQLPLEGTSRARWLLQKHRNYKFAYKVLKFKKSLTHSQLCAVLRCQSMLNYPENLSIHNMHRSHMNPASGCPCSPPRPGHCRTFVCGNSAGRCRWSTQSLRDLPFPSHLHSAAAPLFTSITLIGSQDPLNDLAQRLRFSSRAEGGDDQKIRATSLESSTLPAIRSEFSPVGVLAYPRGGSTSFARGTDDVVVKGTPVGGGGDGLVEKGAGVKQPLVTLCLVHMYADHAEQTERRTRTANQKPSLVSSCGQVQERHLQTILAKLLKPEEHDILRRWGSGGSAVSPLSSYQDEPGFNPRPDHFRNPCGNRAGRCRWMADFLGDLPYPPPFHSGEQPTNYGSEITYGRRPPSFYPLHRAARSNDCGEQNRRRTSFLWRGLALAIVISRTQPPLLSLGFCAELRPHNTPTPPPPPRAVLIATYNKSEGPVVTWEFCQCRATCPRGRKQFDEGGTAGRRECLQIRLPACQPPVPEVSPDTRYFNSLLHQAKTADNGVVCAGNRGSDYTSPAPANRRRIALLRLISFLYCNAAMSRRRPKLQGQRTRKLMLRERSFREVGRHLEWATLRIPFNKLPIRNLLHHTVANQTQGWFPQPRPHSRRVYVPTSNEWTGEILAALEEPMSLKRGKYGAAPGTQGWGKTGYPGENPPTTATVRRDYHMRKSESEFHRESNPRFVVVENELSSVKGTSTPLGAVETKLAKKWGPEEGVGRWQARAKR